MARAQPNMTDSVWTRIAGVSSLWCRIVGPKLATDRSLDDGAHGTERERALEERVARLKPDCAVLRKRRASRAACLPRWAPRSTRLVPRRTRCDSCFGQRQAPRSPRPGPPSRPHPAASADAATSTSVRSGRISASTAVRRMPPSPRWPVRFRRQATAHDRWTTRLAGPRPHPGGMSYRRSRSAASQGRSAISRSGSRAAPSPWSAGWPSFSARSSS